MRDFQGRSIGSSGAAIEFFEGTGVNEIDPAATFETGETPAGLIEALRAHGEYRVAAKRGFYRCFVCEEPENMPTSDWGPFGTGPFEIHLWTDDGTLFVAPSLIVHLIEQHGYLPPSEFVEAALHVAEFEWRLRRGPVAEVMHRVSVAKTAATDWDTIQTRLQGNEALGAVLLRAGVDVVVQRQQLA